MNMDYNRKLILEDVESPLITDEDLGQMWYEWMLDTALGGIGGTVNLAGRSNAEQNEKLRLPEAAILVVNSWSQILNNIAV